jgi:tetratricopeptide (TPR) repeat protein
MTDQPVRCPICDHQLTYIDQYWHCPKHGKVSLEKTAKPLRIFLSYGHDSNEELACSIYYDLKKRGHDVRIDKSKIKFGDDWRRKITDCIIDSHLVLSLLSKHSTRDPGVCLDEIALAVGTRGGNIQSILVESEKEVTPPQSISHIQWLDMHDWKEWKKLGTPAWEQWYEGKLKEIIRVVESEESVRFAGEIKTLEEYLKPVSSYSRIAHLLKKEFIGRVWLFEEVEKWRTAENRASRLFWIMGSPGTGKSAFVAHLAHYGRDKVIAAQFCEYDKPDHRNPARIIRTLAFQIATRLPDYRKILLDLSDIKELDQKKPSELFDYLLASPLRLVIDGGRMRYLVVIDALDEVSEGGRNDLVEMLAQNVHLLPDWIGIVVTSRPEFDVITPLQGLNPVALDRKIESNREDIGNYLHHELKEELEKYSNADLMVGQILDKSEGVFLYAERFCEEVRQNKSFLDHPEQFPNGLSGIFFQYFQRQYPSIERFRNNIRPALRVILAAREPIPLENLKKIFNWSDEDLRDFTGLLGSFFTVIVEGGTEVIRPYHKSLTDWLSDKTCSGQFFVSIQEGHRLLADSGWLEFQKNGPGKMSGYFKYYLPFHLLETKRYGDLVSLLKNREYFSQTWNTDEFLVKSWWAAIEESSDIRIPEVYKDVIAIPIKYSIDYLSAVAKLLADTGYVQKSESIHAYLNVYFLLMFDKRNRQVAIGNLGYISLLKGKYTDALRLFEKQERICRNLSDVEGVLTVLGNKGTAMFKLDMLDEAFDCYKEQENLCVLIHDADNLQMSIGNQGNVFFGSEQFDKAMNSYKKQLELCEKSVNLQGMSQSIGNQGNVFFRLARYEEALEYYKKCEQICKKILYKEGLQRALGDQGKVFMVKRDFSTALGLLDQQESICKNIDSSRSLGECLRLKAQLFEEQMQFEKAEEIYEKLKEIYVNLEDNYGLSDTIECLGLVSLRKGKLDTAYHYFEELENLARRYNNLKKTVEAIIDKGLIFEIRGEFNSALKNYQNAESLCLSKKDRHGKQFRFGLQYAMNNKADILLRKGDLKEGLRLYEIQEKICRETENYAGLQYTLVSQGTIHRDLGNYQRALQSFQEHTSISEKNYKFFEAQHSLGLTGNIYSKIRNFEAAKEQYLKQLQMCNQNDFYHESVESYLHLVFAQNLSQDKNCDLAFETLAREHVRKMDIGEYIGRLLWNQGIAFDLEQDFDQVLNRILTIEPEEGGYKKNETGLNEVIARHDSLLDDLNKWYMKCENECRRIDFPFGLQHVLGRHGLFYALKMDYVSAIPLLTEQNTISKRIGYFRGEEISLGRLATCNLALNKIEDSLSLTEAQNHICIEKGFVEGQMESQSLREKLLAVRVR